MSLIVINNSFQLKLGNQKKNDFLSRIKFFEQKNVVQNKKPFDYKKVKTYKNNKESENEVISSKQNKENNLEKPKIDKIIKTKTVLETNIEKSEIEKSKKKKIERMKKKN